jgi:uncharacterized protein
MSLRPFHLAFPVDNLDNARSFFTGVLGCTEGRSAPRWVDFDFFGHQISAHLDGEGAQGHPVNTVDGDRVPVRHFGLVLPWDEWEQFAEALKEKGATFVIPPKIRFKGKPGEQGTMFVKGPGSNVLEFKSFRDYAAMFAT